MFVVIEGQPPGPSLENMRNSCSRQVLTEMVLWAAAHEETGNQALVRLMKKDKAKFLADIRKRWLLDR